MTGQDKPVIISNVEEGRPDERMTVTYPYPAIFVASRRFLTVRNDCSLFYAARSASLVRISVKDLSDELKGEVVEEPLGTTLLEWLCYSEIYTWCVSCLKTIGANIKYGEHQITVPRSQGQEPSLAHAP